MTWSRECEGVEMFPGPRRIAHPTFTVLTDYGGRRVRTDRSSRTPARYTRVVEHVPRDVS
jgi:hypothetical protein